jgi:ribosome-associated toxin RatA of RatAB toxin-antitoxin module
VKELHGQSAGEVEAPPEHCFELLADVEGYPAWYPQTIRRAEVMQRDGEGRPERALVTLHVAHGPLVHDFDLLLDVRAHHPDHVELVLVREDPSDRERFEVRWQITPGAARTRMDLRLYANLPVPRLVPVGGAFDGIASGFLNAAVGALAPHA